MHQDEENQECLGENLVVEDHGTEFYLISTGDGHDFTLSIEAEVALRLARFIQRRRDLAQRPAGSKN